MLLFSEKAIFEIVKEMKADSYGKGEL